MTSQVERIASKAMGKVKGGMAAARGLRGVFTTLSEEHGELLLLVRRCRGIWQPERRVALFEQIRRDLVVHERCERVSLYAVLADHAGVDSRGRRHEADLGHLEESMARLAELDASSDHWRSLFASFADEFERHIREEETIVYPEAMEVLGEAQAVALDALHRSERRRAWSAS